MCIRDRLGVFGYGCMARRCEPQILDVDGQPMRVVTNPVLKEIRLTGVRRRGEWESKFNEAHPGESEQAARHPNPVNTKWRNNHDGGLNIRPGYETKAFNYPTLRGGTHTTTAGHASGWKLAAAAMGIDWMNRDELTQAIPPAYTEHIGVQLIAAIMERRPHANEPHTAPVEQL